MVIAACLAGKLVRNEYGADPATSAVEADVTAWRRVATAAQQALSTKAKSKRGK